MLHKGVGGLGGDATLVVLVAGHHDVALHAPAGPPAGERGREGGREGGRGREREGGEGSSLTDDT